MFSEVQYAAETGADLLTSRPVESCHARPWELHSQKLSLPDLGRRSAESYFTFKQRDKEHVRLWYGPDSLESTIRLLRSEDRVQEPWNNVACRCA
jgi:hypothetical protein